MKIFYGVMVHFLSVFLAIAEGTGRNRQCISELKLELDYWSALYGRPDINQRYGAMK